MRTVDITFRPGVPEHVVASFVGQLREQRTLGDLMNWLRTLEPPRTVDEVITQDEYTHDVLVRLGPELVLAFDTT